MSIIPSESPLALNISHKSKCLMLKGIARTLNFGINAKDESISNVDLAQTLPPSKILVGMRVLQLGVLGCLGY
jgi:hypothetical protein